MWEEEGEGERMLLGYLPTYTSYSTLYYTIYINIAYVHVYIISKHVNQIEDPKNTTKKKPKQQQNKIRCDLVITLAAAHYTNEYIVYIYI